MYLKSPWFLRNVQIQNDLEIDPVTTFIRTSVDKFKLNIDLVPGARFLQIGQPTVNKIMKSRLIQDFNIFLNYVFHQLMYVLFNSWVLHWSERNHVFSLLLSKCKHFCVQQPYF